MILPNPNGIGVVACTDCKDGKIKRSNMKDLDTTFAKIVFILCLIAWMLWPKQAGAQTTPTVTKRAGEYHNSNIEFQTDGLTRFRTSNVDTVAQKKDTILVDILCKYPIVKFTGDNGNEYTIEPPNPIFRGVRQERTLEWQTRWEFQGSDDVNFGLSGVEVSEWRVIETRWLDLIEGCYQLTPLTNE